MVPIFWLSRQIFVLEYIWLFQTKAYIMRCNLNQSLKGMEEGNFENYKIGVGSQKANMCVQGWIGGLKIGVWVRTYFMDAPLVVCEVIKAKLYFDTLINLIIFVATLFWSIFVVGPSEFKMDKTALISRECLKQPTWRH